MAQRVPPYTVRVADGARLVAGGSSGAVGARDYVEKVNFRRLDDAEIRREGTVLFRPNTGLAQGTQAVPASSADVVGMWEAVRPNGDRAVVALTATTVHRYTHSTGVWTQVGGPYTSCLEWQVESSDGYLIFNNKVDLPFTYRVEESATVPIHEMRDIGIAAVGTITVYNGFLLCADVTEISSDELTDWMNGLTPYGIPPDNITNRIRYKIVWSDYNQPRNWAPLIAGATILDANHAQVILPYPAPFAFPVGSKLAVVGAGPGGGTLGGQVGIDDGVVVTAVSGATLTLSVAADTALTYPLTVQVVRFADVSTFVGSSSVQDDSSAILAMKPLKRGLVVYRETGIFTGRYTGAVETPFLFTPEWAGRLVPPNSRVIANVDGDYHLYPSRDRFYMFDGAGEPRLHEVMDSARSLFFADLTSANFHLAWAVNNPITKEAWFFCPNGVLAFDYAGNTASWIDETYTAAAYVRKPGSDDFWFILARAGSVLQYGATDEGPFTYLRLGVSPVASLKFGVTSLGDDANEKIVDGYTVLLGTASEDFDLNVLLHGGDSYAEPLEELLDYLLDTPASLPLVETFYQNIYFQDEIRVTGAGDIPVNFVGRVFSVQRVRSAGQTRNLHGNS